MMTVAVMSIGFPPRHEPFPTRKRRICRIFWLAQAGAVMCRSREATTGRIIRNRMHRDLGMNSASVEIEVGNEFR